jgi:hypothetical protein
VIDVRLDDQVTHEVRRPGTAKGWLEPGTRYLARERSLPEAERLLEIGWPLSAPLVSSPGVGLCGLPAAPCRIPVFLHCRVWSGCSLRFAGLRWTPATLALLAWCDCVASCEAREAQITLVSLAFAVHRTPGR